MTGIIFHAAGGGDDGGDHGGDHCNYHHHRGSRSVQFERLQICFGIFGLPRQGRLSNRHTTAVSPKLLDEGIFLLLTY